MTEPKNIKAIETGSGILWKDWLTFLDKYNDLGHADLAKIAYENIQSEGRSKSPEWWAQAVTIAYERHIGKRQTGQQHNGKFSVTVSKTVSGTMDETLVSWLTRVNGMRTLRNIEIKEEPRVSQTEKWRYWRCSLADGSKISVNIQQKPTGSQSILAVNHDNLAKPEDVNIWREFWKTYLAR